MKLFLLVLFLFPTLLKAQNLVPNPNFADLTGCPDGVDEMYYAIGWSSFSQSPDYFNECNDTNYAYGGIPDNNFGYQNAVSGNAYCGLVTFSNGSMEYREFVGIKLSAVLIPGDRYYASIKVSLADSSYFASDKLGLSFSTVLYNDGASPAPINNRAFVYTDSVIYDTANWTIISGSFIADSAYQYIMIGNFFNDNNTFHPIVPYQADSFFDAAYYYIGYVCVSPDSLGCDLSNGINSSIPNEGFNVYPNPTSDLLHISLPSGSSTLIIYNLLGQEVYSAIGQKNKASINVSSFPNGVYFLQIKTGSNILYKQLIIQK